MSDNCRLPFDVTLYIFKVSVVIVFIKLFTQCNEIQNTAKCLTFRFEVNQIIALLVSQKLTVYSYFCYLSFECFISQRNISNNIYGFVNGTIQGHKLSRAVALLA